MSVHNATQNPFYEDQAWLNLAHVAQSIMRDIPQLRDLLDKDTAAWDDLDRALQNSVDLCKNITELGQKFSTLNDLYESQVREQNQLSAATKSLQTSKATVETELKATQAKNQSAHSEGLELQNRLSEARQSIRTIQDREATIRTTIGDFEGKLEQLKRRESAILEKEKIMTKREEELKRKEQLLQRREESLLNRTNELSTAESAAATTKRTLEEEQKKLQKRDRILDDRERELERNQEGTQYLQTETQRLQERLSNQESALASREDSLQTASLKLIPRQQDVTANEIKVKQIATTVRDTLLEVSRLAPTPFQLSDVDDLPKFCESAKILSQALTGSIKQLNTTCEQYRIDIETARTEATRKSADWDIIHKRLQAQIATMRKEATQQRTEIELKFNEMRNETDLHRNNIDLQLHETKTDCDKKVADLKRSVNEGKDKLREIQTDCDKQITNLKTSVTEWKDRATELQQTIDNRQAEEDGAHRTVRAERDQLHREITFKTDVTNKLKRKYDDLLDEARRQSSLLAKAQDDHKSLTEELDHMRTTLSKDEQGREELHRSDMRVLDLERKLSETRRNASSFRLACKREISESQAKVRKMAEAARSSERTMAEENARVRELEVWLERREADITTQEKAVETERVRMHNRWKDQVILVQSAQAIVRASRELQMD